MEWNHTCIASAFLKERKIKWAIWNFSGCAVTCCWWSYPHLPSDEHYCFKGTVLTQMLYFLISLCRDIPSLYIQCAGMLLGTLSLLLVRTLWGSGTWDLVVLRGIVCTSLVAMAISSTHACSIQIILLCWLLVVIRYTFFINSRSSLVW